MRVQLVLVFTCFQFVVGVVPAFAQPAKGIPTWAEIEQRIEQADAEGLKVLEAELKQLPADVIETAGDIKFAAMIGARYAELSMPELAVDHYKQAIAIPHSQEREEAYGCANMWSVAMDSLLCHYFENDQKAKLLPTLEQAKNHSAAYAFQAQYHALQIGWRNILCDSAASATYAEREIAKLLREMPKSPTAGELESLIELVDEANEAPSDARIRWLETIGASVEREIRAHRDSYKQFRNLVNVRFSLAGIIASRKGDPALLDKFASGLQEFTEFALADAGSKEEQGYVRETADWFHKRLEEIKAETVPAAVIGKPAAQLSGTWADEDMKTSLEQLRGRVVVLDFWAIWCGPCVATFPKLKKLYEQYDRQQLEIVGITRAYGYRWDEETKTAIQAGENDAAETPESQQAERTAVKRFTAGHGLAYPQLIEDIELSKFYGVEGLPTVVVIDSQGKVADVFVGGGKEQEERLFELVGKLLKAGAKKKASNEGN